MLQILSGPRVSWQELRVAMGMEVRGYSHGRRLEVIELVLLEKLP